MLKKQNLTHDHPDLHSLGNFYLQPLCSEVIYVEDCLELTGNFIDKEPYYVINDFKNIKNFLVNSDLKVCWRKISRKRGQNVEYIAFLTNEKELFYFLERASNLLDLKLVKEDFDFIFSYFGLSLIKIIRVLNFIKETGIETEEIPNFFTYDKYDINEIIYHIFVGLEIERIDDYYSLFNEFLLVFPDLVELMKEEILQTIHYPKTQLHHLIKKELSIEQLKRIWAIPFRSNSQYFNEVMFIKFSG